MLRKHADLMGSHFSRGKNAVCIEKHHYKNAHSFHRSGVGGGVGLEPQTSGAITRISPFLGYRMLSVL